MPFEMLRKCEEQIASLRVAFELLGKNGNYGEPFEAMRVKLAELTHTLNFFIAQRNKLNTEIVTLRHENEELRSSKVTLTRDYTMTKEKLTVAEHSIETLKGQLVVSIFIIISLFLVNY